MSKFTPSIYHISVEQQRINDMLCESDGELTPEIEEALAINEANLANKVEDYATSILKLKATASMADEEIKRLQALKKSCINAAERMTQAVSTAMENFGYDRLEVGTHRLSFRKSDGVVIENEQDIPASYIIIEQKINKSQIKADLKAGIPVAGAILENRRNLQIR